MNHGASSVAPVMRLAAEIEGALPRGAGVARLGPDELVLFERAVPPAGPPAPSPMGGSRGRFDALRAIHACYAPETTTEGWVEGVIAALRPLAPSARWFEWSRAPFDAAIEQVVDAIGRECYRDLLRPSPPVQLLSTRLRSLPPELERRVAALLRARGVEDALLLSGGDVHGHPIVLGMLAAHGFRPPSRTVGSLRHVAGHLNTARLLREPFTRGGAFPTAARSIAPRAVSELVARGAFRWVDAAEETHRWSSFVGGRYALVDHWAAGDRRRILVRRCHAAGDPAALRPGETAALAQRFAGEVWTAGGAAPRAMATTTAALHLSSARARLRCGSRRELASLVSRTRYEGTSLREEPAPAR